MLLLLLVYCLSLTKLCVNLVFDVVVVSVLSSFYNHFAGGGGGGRELASVLL